MWYFIIILLIIFLQIVQLFVKKNSNGILLLSILVLLFFSALRGNGNGDYFHYLEYSKMIHSTKDLFNNSFPMEFGFRLLSYLVDKLSLDSQWVIAMMNVISLSFIYLFIKKNSKDYMFSVILFLPVFFMFDMHTARTAVAISISAFGFKFIIEKNIYKYIITIFFASLFHKIAWILLPFYFLRILKRTYIFYIVSIIFSMFLVKLINVYSIFNKLLSLIGLDGLLLRINNYTDNELYGYSFSLMDPRMLFSIIILIFSIYTLEKVNHNSNKYKVTVNNITFLRQLVKMNWLSIILMIFSSANTLLTIRIYGLTSIYLIIQLPFVLYLYRYKMLNVKLVYFIKILVIASYLVYLFLILKNYPEYIFYFLRS